MAQCKLRTKSIASERKVDSQRNLCRGITSRTLVADAVTLTAIKSPVAERQLSPGRNGFWIKFRRNLLVEWHAVFGCHLPGQKFCVRGKAGHASLQPGTRFVFHFSFQQFFDPGTLQLFANPIQLRNGVRKLAAPFLGDNLWPAGSNGVTRVARQAS